MPAELLHTDVVIVGAGISGIGAAYYLQTECQGRSYTILEGRDSLGGTWDLFRYPGVRSDSDMYTLGYRFKPWTDDKSIAEGESILDYLHETVEEFGIEPHIRYGHQVTRAEWSSETSTWTLTTTQTDSGDTVRYTCNVLFMCSGYYSYKGGYTPAFSGLDVFDGPIVHPQQWPDDLDYTDKDVVVIGSGATAVTLVPALATKARHVTMLQRSPTYMASQPSVDAVAQRLRKFLPDTLAYRLTRWKNVTYNHFIYRNTRTRPAVVKKKLLAHVHDELGTDFDVDTHFTPTYDPWDQRLCLVPDSDLFNAITSGQASVVTDTIDTFTESGVLLDSGEEIPADVIVTATGLKLVTVGDMDFVVDGEPVDFSNTWTYRGLGYSDVPNMVSSFGYINASWTLRVDLTFPYVCRVLNHMAESGFDRFTPRLRASDTTMPARPWIDDFSSGYVTRDMAMLPKQGDREPWLNPQNYPLERQQFRKAAVEDGVLEFGRAPNAAR